MTSSDHDRLLPEQRARVRIDGMLAAAGWVVQDYKTVNLYAGTGVAVRELVTNAGPADYVLFVNRQAVGVIEAKKKGTTLSGVEWQTVKYQANLPDALPAYLLNGHLPYGYESTGDETWFTCRMDPEPTARRVFWFHQPETLMWEIEDQIEHAGGTLRARIPAMPDLEHDPARLRDAQFAAITNLERSFKDNHSRALIQMATGSGKTLAAANICERLIRHVQAKRILFLVDRANLGKQTLKEFQGFEVPGSGRKFTELYNVQHLTHNKVDPVASVCIGTIQRVYSMLRDDADLAEDVDETSGYELVPDRPVEVDYQPALPIEAFDVIIVDECHRSIYGVWRQVLEYFDAFLIGLTATPGKQTFGFFNKNLVMEYGFPEAVADGVNVDFDVFRLSTAITEAGSTIEGGQGYVTTFRNRETRQERLEAVDEDLAYDARALDRKVVAKDQIRTIVRAFRDNLPAMFPARDVDEHDRLVNIPKTLIFAKDDSHAEDIVRIAREELGKGNDVIAKITYKASDGTKPEQLLQDFRTAYYPRIAVTVDMIATGTDVKPIEMVVFMRMVRSRNYFEQMKGRGVRTIPDSDLQVVTPDATHKDRFVLVDAIGVTETKLIESFPLERKRGVSIEKLLHQVALGQISEDLVSTLASRLARID
ncbi:MAG: DEAD/DEAH box helicase family protein, partial [Aquihabitans sp.]